jgi:hypothetical protein
MWRKYLLAIWRNSQEKLRRLKATAQLLHATTLRQLTMKYAKQF